VRVRGYIPRELSVRTVKLLRDAAAITARSGLTNLSAELTRTADEWKTHFEKASAPPQPAQASAPSEGGAA
jgi:hypothetical protein